MYIAVKSKRTCLRIAVLFCVWWACLQGVSAQDNPRQAEVIQSGLYAVDNDKLTVLDVPDAAFRDWSSNLVAHQLDDQSSIYSYSASTLGDTDSRGRLVLAVSFVPRFGCAPLVSFRFPASDTVPVLGNGLSISEVEIEIDGELQRYPAVFSVRDGYNHFSISTPRPERDQLRRLIDIGDFARVRLVNTQSATDQRSETGTGQNASRYLFETTYSLLGSRRSIAAVERACQSH